MSHYQGDDAEYMEDEYEMEDVDDDMDEEFRAREMGSDSDIDEYDYLKMEKTFREFLGRGLASLEINYRQTRLEQYKNYENIPHSGEDSKKDCKITKKGGHLRNLVWATTKHDVYLMSHFSVIHWSSLTCSKADVLDVSGHVAPTETQVSTLAVKDNLLVAGGFQGELICKHLDRPGVSFCSRTTYDDNAINQRC
ncbi:hypothetical protein NC652_028629 [Populus alba x Populus x berolinensis]|nr:hypothetical protein NC652_028629 [Populus alba x Populus x berolinensis]